MNAFPDKSTVVRTPISMTTYGQILDALEAPRADRATVVAVCNVHSVMEATRDQRLAEALSDADIATPDGVPIVWALRLTARRAYRHYVYGSDPETLATLLRRIEQDYPQSRVVGASSPPFRAQTDDEVAADLDAIGRSGANVVWVGLGMPKQELWMHQVKDRLPGVTLVGVGAAFDFIAGTKRQAPPWMQRAGLEWLFRLIQEPGRLWRRYLVNNPLFLLALGRQIARQRWGRRGADRAGP